MDDFLTTTQASARYGFSATYLAKLCHDGTLVARKAGRDWLIDPDSMKAYAENWRDRKPGPKGKKHDEAL